MKTLLITAMLTFAASMANAQDSTSTSTTTTQAPPEWMKYTQPGEAHKKTLENVVGSFTYTIKMWMDPKAKPEQETGTSENKWILGGRFVQQEVKGRAMGQDFEGIGMTGYDNFTGEFQSTWVDNMSTAIMLTKGANSPTTKTIKEEGTGSNPYKNEKNHWFRTELKIKDKNEHTYTMYTKDADGKEYKSMEMIYKRKK